MMKKQVHAVDLRSTHPSSGHARTRCGRDASRAGAVRVGVRTSSDPLTVTCKTCRSHAVYA